MDPSDVQFVAARPRKVSLLFAPDDAPIVD